MKATGIVRRIDDLGRVVIPKEIRRVMRMTAVRITPPAAEAPAPPPCARHRAKRLTGIILGPSCEEGNHHFHCAFERVSRQVKSGL